VDVAAPHDDPAVLLARLVSFGLLVDRGVLRELVDVVVLAP
jgi:hypothetical protein